nr:PREDICTED: uncharacterized protein LOC103540946 [Equus przewalskii]
MALKPESPNRRSHTRGTGQQDNDPGSSSGASEDTNPWYWSPTGILHPNLHLSVCSRGLTVTLLQAGVSVSSFPPPDRSDSGPSPSLWCLQPLENPCLGGEWAARAPGPAPVLPAEPALGLEGWVGLGCALGADRGSSPGRLGSTSSNSSCGSAEYPGEAIPHHPGLPKADPGHWWTSFFFGKSTLPFMATVLESPEHSESPQASSSTITCDLAPEASRKQPGGQPAKANAGPRS